MKKLLCLCLAAALLISMAGCSKSAREDAMILGVEATEEPRDNNKNTATDSAFGGAATTTKPGSPSVSDKTAPETPQAPDQPPIVSGNYVPKADEKLIYSGNLEVETQSYTACLESLNVLLQEAGGFVEHSTYYNGGDYNKDGTTSIGSRSATLTLRVPSGRFQDFFNRISTIGMVRNSQSQVENITAQYQDTGLQLASLQVQHDRLLEMLKKAEKVEDMITIESKLAQLRLQMDALQSQLKNWDTSVNFSTVKLSISEVVQYTPQPSDNFFARLWRTVKNAVSGYGDTAEGLFFGLIAWLPYLLTIGIVWLVLRKPIKKLTKKVRTIRSNDDVPPNL